MELRTYGIGNLFGFGKKKPLGQSGKNNYQGIMMERGCQNYSGQTVQDIKPGYFRENIFVIISRLLVVTSVL